MVHSEHLLHFLVFNLRVILCKKGLLLLEVVELAVMRFGMTMFWAENVATFTWCLNETNFAAAQPTLIGVCLYEIT